MSKENDIQAVAAVLVYFCRRRENPRIHSYMTLAVLNKVIKSMKFVDPKWEYFTSNVTTNRHPPVIQSLWDNLSEYV